MRVPFEMSREEADRMFEETFPDWSRAEVLRARHEPATGIVLERRRGRAVRDVPQIRSPLVPGQERRARQAFETVALRSGRARPSRGPQGVQTVRLTLRVDKGLVAEVGRLVKGKACDCALEGGHRPAPLPGERLFCRRCGREINPEGFSSISEALRAGLGKALDALDAGGALPQTEAGDWQIVALKISPELDARIGKAVAAGRAPSVVALVRGAAAMLLEGRA